jgi:fructose-1,6-bisphosphatase/inositol monophosphatase family enzyme
MSISYRQLESLGDLLRAAARAEIMPRFRRLDVGAIRSKTGPLDLVTDADEAAERLITAALEQQFPGCVVVGEEAASRDSSLLERIGEADLSFVVDPVDGTFNYASGLPLFGCMTAAMVRGEVVAAAILDPIGDDIAFALRGEGAWMMAADGRRRDLRVAAPVPVAEMTGSISWRFMSEPQRTTICSHFPRVAAVFDYRCAAHEYRLLADGGCHFLMFNKLMPWDHAPGWLLHQEAGGYAALLDGREYRPTVLRGGLLCTPDQESWGLLRAALLEG